MAQRPAPPDETITYQFEMDREAWREWTDNVPRSTPIHDRLRTLIELDTAVALETFDVARCRLVDMKADRITEKARQGQNAIRKREKPEQAVEKLAGIEEIAGSLSLGIEADE